MTKLPLCATCQQIDFALLRGPRTSDISSLRAGHLPDQYPYKNNDAVRQRKINLGFLSDMKERKNCPLCVFIWQFSSKQGVYTEDGRTQSGARVMCKADIGSHAGIFRYPEKDADDLVKMWQLVITTHIEGHALHSIDGNPHLYLDNCFRVCDVGASSIQVRSDFADPRMTVDMTLFGGRIRPLQIDLSWLRRWLEICEHDHHDTCGILLPMDNLFE